jgi:4-amino-4-deoxy-L-arabinose transferase-like glycosyltransferase
MEVTVTEKTVRPVLKARRISRERALELIALAAIVVLAAGLRFGNLDALGYANHYYTAAVQAMLQSWHNFFFAAAEPGGSVTVDKPPVGLWFQVVSAYFLGVNGLGVLLPQIIAGILSVIVVYYLVRRWFGAAAGLVAGLALAITPVVVATDRNNTMDSTLILTLLLAALAFILATERGKLRYLLLGALLVGIGFNIKMLEAYLPLPVFFALYFLGSPERLWRKSLNLVLATALLLMVSLSWATIVDLTPASQRPYVGSSGDNSEWSLAIGYNGVERLLGMGGRGGLLAGLLSDSQNNDSRGASGQVPNGAFQPPQAQLRDDGFRSPQGFRAPQQHDGNGEFQPPQGAPNRNGGGGMFNTGQPGALRLFIAPLSKESSWLLPFGLFAVLLLLFRARLHWPLETKHQAVVLWGGWLATVGIFFSVAGFFHEYYLSMLAPSLAALVGIGVIELWHVREKHPWVAMILLLLATGATLGLQHGAGICRCSLVVSVRDRAFHHWRVAADPSNRAAIGFCCVNRLCLYRRGALDHARYLVWINQPECEHKSIVASSV